MLFLLEKKKRKKEEKNDDNKFWCREYKVKMGQKL